MGGYNSGGHNHKGRPTVEECLKLPVKALKEFGALSQGSMGSLSWDNQSRISYETRWEDMIVLKWRTLDDNQGHEQHLGFQWLAHKRHYGGYQYYLVCPECYRPCMDVYLYGSFACRLCHQLSYSSQRESSTYRMLRRLSRDISLE